MEGVGHIPLSAGLDQAGLVLLLVIAYPMMWACSVSLAHLEVSIADLYLEKECSVHSLVQTQQFYLAWYDRPCTYSQLSATSSRTSPWYWATLYGAHGVLLDMSTVEIAVSSIDASKLLAVHLPDVWADCAACCSCWCAARRACASSCSSLVQYIAFWCSSLVSCILTAKDCTWALLDWHRSVRIYS